MKHYNPDIADACEESTWPYIIGPYLAKNVFCLMCAAESPISSAGLCYFLGDRGTVDGYTLLLDYTSLSADPTEEDSNCGMNEIFDDFLVRRKIDSQNNDNVKNIINGIFVFCIYCSFTYMCILVK